MDLSQEIIFCHGISILYLDVSTWICLLGFYLLLSCLLYNVLVYSCSNRLTIPAVSVGRILVNYIYR